MGVVATVSQPQEKRFFGKCATLDGDEIVLVARAASEVEASQKLHSNYRIEMVFDILTPEQMWEERRDQTPSLLRTSVLT